MKRYYFLLFSLVFITAAHSQIINFSDPLFKAKLVQSNAGNFIARNLNGDYFALDSNSNGEIEMNEALELGYLDVAGYSITSLSGIQHFTNLVYLECENNQIQTLNVSSLANLINLNCSNNLITNLNISGLTELHYLNCQFNQINNLNADGIIALLDLDCSYNNLGSLSLVGLENLESLNCSNNILGTIDLTDLIYLRTFDCSYNQLLSIDTSSLTSMESLICNSNSLSSLMINGLVNFNALNCSNNQLLSLNLINLGNLIDLNCDFNQLPLINLSNSINLKNFSGTNNQLSLLNLNGLSQLESVYCSNNQISTIGLLGLNNLITLDCNNNHIGSFDLSNLSALKYLYCNSNWLTDLNPNGLNALKVISCSNNQITVLNLNNCVNLQTLYCMNNQLSTLDASQLTNLQSLYCSNNQLINLFIKNGTQESNLQFSGNSNLQYICADEDEIDAIQYEINTNNYTNCQVNSYCSFVPGGLSYMVQGMTKFDSNTNGCNASDINYPNLQISFSDGTNSEKLFADGSGAYSKSLKIGSYTITPLLENPNYYSIFPSVLSLNFPQDVSPYSQNFCVTSNGNHFDIEATILPLSNVIPGQDATYKIVYKNKGTQAQSGTVNLIFNDAVLDLIQSNPTTTSQSTNHLIWNFSNLLPLETRTIIVKFNANTTIETPSLNFGQTLAFTAVVSTTAMDETPNDNTSQLNQIVVNAAEIINKTCIEGISVSSSQVGEYVHYIIRFKNDGTTIAQNIVVKDNIDSTKFDITTLKPIDGSHSFETRISGIDKVEFIFQNINLSPSSPNNDCYVAFKIKTLPTLIIGEIFTNTASIYFDYKMPLDTNTESTTIQALSNQSFEPSNNFKVFPNPVKNKLNIGSPNSFTISTVSIYNTLGQLMQIISNPTTASFDVSELKTGIYFLHLTTQERTTTSIQFIKE